MTALLRLTTLDDAYFFLNQAKGLPEIPSARSLRQRYIRACIMFSWIALEEMLDSYVAENKLSAPAGLRDRLAAALKHISSVDPASDSFQEARKIRNLLTHGTDDRTEAAILTANSASKVFNYCASMIAQLGGHRKLCLSLDDGTWRPWGEKRPRRRLP